MFPLPVPNTPEELAANLQIMSADLGLTEDEIKAHAYAFARGEGLPDIYTEDDKGYIYTIIYILTGNKSEEQLWSEKADVLLDNLLYFIEEKQVTIEEILTIMQKVVQAYIHQKESSVFYENTEMEQTFYAFEYFIRTALQFQSGALAMIPMLADLIRAGQQNLSDLIYYLRDTIIVGIQEDDENWEEENEENETEQ
ncbi:MAG TPA: hypothetical protein DCM08_06915 [Microscillaceae bacterium]|jgi:hypothetical protein|nr:hypothetical protein [Microscillaceae bacterium]